MKRRYRITDKRPTDAEIGRSRDHARLQANYNKALRMVHRKPIYKDRRAFLAIVIIVLLAWLINEAREGRDEAERDQRLEQTGH